MVNSGIIAEGKYKVARPGLTALEVDLQAVTLRRRWDQLFDMTGGSAAWRTNIYPPMLGKYSFIDRKTTVYPISQLYQPVKTGGRVTTVRQYIPFSEADLRSFVFSKHYRVQEGWNCTDAQREGNLQNWIALSNRNKNTYSSGTWEHIFPIFPGQDICSKPPKKSLWVKVRSKVYIAVAIVAAVYLGPIVLEKVGAMLAQGAAGGSGAGGAGASAAGASSAGGIATATQTTTFIAKVNKAVTLYNKVNSVVHIVQGKIPPPPIGITGATFREVAFNAVKEELKEMAIEKAFEEGTKYIEKKLTEAEEGKIRAEIAELQKKMDALVSKDTPIIPSPELPEQDREKIREIQVIQAKREQDQVAILALAAGATVFLLAG